MYEYRTLRDNLCNALEFATSFLKFLKQPEYITLPLFGLPSISLSSIHLIINFVFQVVNKSMLCNVKPQLIHLHFLVILVSFLLFHFHLT